jgi:hypothetical protein
MDIMKNGSTLLKYSKKAKNPRKSVIKISNSEDYILVGSKKKGL